MRASSPSAAEELRVLVARIRELVPLLPPEALGAARHELAELTAPPVKREDRSGTEQAGRSDSLEDEQKKSEELQASLRTHTAIVIFSQCMGK